MDQHRLRTRLLLVALMLPLLIDSINGASATPARADASLTTDRTAYYVGDEAEICYRLPAPGPFRILDISQSTDGQRAIVRSGVDDGGGACFLWHIAGIMSRAPMNMAPTPAPPSSATPRVIVQPPLIGTVVFTGTVAQGTSIGVTSGFGSSGTVVTAEGSPAFKCFLLEYGSDGAGGAVDVCVEALGPEVSSRWWVTATSGGAYVQTGTPVRAVVNGRTCGHWLANGSLPTSINLPAVQGAYTRTAAGPIIDSITTSAGCARPGDTVQFEIDGVAADQSFVFSGDYFQRFVALTVPRSPRNRSGYVTSVVVEPRCLPAPDESACSAEDELLWDGHRQTWLDVLRRQGSEVSDQTPPSVLSGMHTRFRAGRGEIFSRLYTATNDGGSFLYIEAVQFLPSEDEPVTYVALYSVGGEPRGGARKARPVGGWQLRTSSGGQLTFPDDAELPQGACPVYVNLPPNTTPPRWQLPICPLLVLQGSPLGDHDTVELLDATGERVDALSW